MMHEGMSGMGPVMMAVLAIVVVVPFWRICTRAGFSGWLGLLAAIPLLNLVLVYFLAFSRWPIETRGPSKAEPDDVD